MQEWKRIENESEKHKTHHNGKKTGDDFLKLLLKEALNFHLEKAIML